MSRTKHIDSPETLWTQFEDYRIWVEANPWLVEDFVGKDGKQVTRKRARPMSIAGFEVFLGDRNLLKDVHDYLANTGNRYKDFELVARRIKANILACQLEGAMVGVFKENIVARYNGIQDRAQVETFNRTFEITMDLGNKLEGGEDAAPITFNLDVPI